MLLLNLYGQCSDTHFLSPFISLVILGNNTEFEKVAHLLFEKLSFDVDVRKNLFEVSNSTTSCKSDSYFSLCGFRASVFLNFDRCGGCTFYLLVSF